MKILFLAARLPYPPIKGDKLRAYHQLKYLSNRHNITLISILEADEERAILREIEPLCSRVRAITVPKLKSLSNMLLRGPFTRLPLQVLYYYSPVVRQAVMEELAAQPYDLIHVQLLRMAPYVTGLPRRPPVFCDLIDALGLNMKRRRDREKLSRRWLFDLEYRRVTSFERRIVEILDLCAVVSETDRQAICGSEPLPNLVVNPNGVDLETFPFTSGPRDPDIIIFSGNMGYFPNIDAVQYFANQVFPKILEKRPSTVFRIVGANPSPEVQALHNGKSIQVTGWVESVHQEISRAALVVCPMQSGSGIQNKVLEAMATGTPVVGTSKAFGGIQLQTGREAAVVDDPEAMAHQIVSLLANPSRREEMSHDAHQFVKSNYSWDYRCREMEQMYQQLVSFQRNYPHLPRIY